MKEYEVIWEIFNKCPRNQMRDVFVEEVEIADPEAYSKDLEALFENDVEIGEIKTIPKAALKGISIKPAKLRPILKYIV